ncbi:SMI1/KNR4 family protein [uncultured Tenacibaculum sp.]|uniref:SMI1/KNR4 family protein n=1 Tax=uncultured Tenacibaculum sp. TaxID=174713 RepID=UPI0026300373|nr:SMI1/KNR4 family protein [uncultured Tenacibaculum sp.]
MEKLFKELSISAIKLGDVPYTQEQVENSCLKTDAATESNFEVLEKRLGCKLPSDYKELMLLTNGFPAPNSIEPSFLPLEKVNFLKDIDSELIEAYSIEGIEEVGENLERSILVGGVDEEQYFLLIPPNKEGLKWRYWKFANWIPGEEPYENLRHYFKTVIEFNETEFSLENES